MRIFLDTCTFQLIHDYGEFVFEGYRGAKDDKIQELPNGLRNLEALYNIMQVESMSGPSFSFVLSESSMGEIDARGDPYYSGYASDVLDSWLITVEEQGAEAFTGAGENHAETIEDSGFDYLSVEDRKLIGEALHLECEVFLTVEEKLPKHADHLNEELPLRVLRPFELWEEVLAPHFRPQVP